MLLIPRSSLEVRRRRESSREIQILVSGTKPVFVRSMKVPDVMIQLWVNAPQPHLDMNEHFFPALHPVNMSERGGVEH